VAGTFTLGGAYSGVLQSRNSTEKMQVDFTTLTGSATGNLFTGAYTMARAGVIVDKGTVAFQPTTTIFAIQGRAADGQVFYGVMDTLDAGQSFFGILFLDPQKPDSWYAEFTIAVKAPTATTPPTALPGGTLSCAAVEGASIFAQDGKYIGKITWNSFDQDSIGNTFGLYGSEFSNTSIFNSFSQYGSEFSTLSAFNLLATRPPIVYVNGRAQWFLSVNTTMSPRLAPAQLYPCIRR
jgi:hypothetical protein